MCMLVKLRDGGRWGGLSGGHEDEKSSCSRHKTQRLSSGAAEEVICCPKDIYYTTERNITTSGPTDILHSYKENDWSLYR